MSPSRQESPGEQIVLRLPADTVAIADARRAVRELCTNQSLEHLTDDAQLLTSELVSNAVRCSDSAITLRASSQTDGLTVTVVDDGTSVPRPGPPVPHPPAVTAERGRGLFLVDQLADDWGSSPDTVWFRLA